MSFRYTGVVVVAAIAGALAQGTLPESRWGQATTVVNTKLLVHGGKTDSTNSYSYTSAPNTAQLLSLDLSSSFEVSNPPWTTLNTANAPSVAFHTITAYSANQILLFGGDPGPSTALSTQNDSAAILDLATGETGTWSVQTDGWASEPMRRQYHAATLYESQVIITGGEKVDGSDSGFKDSYLFTPNSGSDPTFSQFATTYDGPDLVGHAALALPNGTLLLLGGYSHDLHALQPFTTVHTLDIAAGRWGQVTTSPEPEPSPTSPDTVAPQAPASSGDAPAPDPTPDPTPEDGWGVPTRRRNFAAVLVGDNKILIHGGVDAGLQQARGDAYILDLSTCHWKELPKLNQAVGDRWGHSAVAVGNSVFFAFGYSGSGPASNNLVLYDSASDQLLTTFTPASNPIPPNGNSPPASSSGGGNGNTGGGSTGTIGNGGGGSTNGPSKPSQTGGSDSGSENKTPAILGGVFGGLAAAALVIILIVVYRRRTENERRGYGRRAATDDSEKQVMMLGGFEAAPHGRGFAKLFNLQPAPPRGRERFDILAEEDAAYAALGNSGRPRAYRTGTGGSGSTNNRGSGYFSRWSVFGGAVDASVGSLRSAFGLTPAIGSPGANKDEYMDLGNSASRRSLNVSAGPPSAWRRGSSYTGANRADPFGDEHGVEEIGVEEEYRRAMAMQHEGIRRAGTSGADDYSALVLDNGRRGVPLEPVPSVSNSTNPSLHSNGDPEGSEDRHVRLATSDSTHLTSLRTPVEHTPIPMVYSPPPSGQYYKQFAYNDNSNRDSLQRATSSGSRIGSSLTRALSAVSSLFGSPPPPYIPVNRGRRSSAGHSKGGWLSPGGEYTDLRDPNPPPPMLGLGLVPIDERSFTPRAGTSAEGGSASSHYMGKPPLVLKPLHGKSLSSLRTANSEALERLGTGNWDVVQRDATGSSRQTEGSNATLGSDMTDLGAGDGMRWRDVVGDRAPVESPGGMEGAYDHGAFWNERNARAATGPGSPVGPRPMP
ncbi:hypothetical protein M408DRAFT_105395, partial [Serendipita vermifera MAFF 305830]